MAMEAGLAPAPAALPVMATEAAPLAWEPRAWAPLAWEPLAWEPRTWEPPAWELATG